MDCKNARLLLEVAHPLATELDARDKVELAGHLSDCPECGPWAETEQRIDEHLGLAIRSIPVPSNLSRRIVGRLNVERDAWYRGWVVRTVGVAATLLLAVWVGWAMWWSKKPTLDIEEFVAAETYLYKSEQVEGSFAELGVAMTAPPDFDYAYLASHRLVDFQGKRVPYLLFARPDKVGLAEIYVLSDRQFNLEDVKDTLRAGSQKNFRIVSYSSIPNTKYLVVYPVSMPAGYEVFLRPRAKALN